MVHYCSQLFAWCCSHSRTLVALNEHHLFWDSEACTIWFHWLKSVSSQVSTRQVSTSRINDAHDAASMPWNLDQCKVSSDWLKWDLSRYLKDKVTTQLSPRKLSSNHDLKPQWSEVISGSFNLPRCQARILLPLSTSAIRKIRNRLNLRSIQRCSSGPRIISGHLSRPPCATHAYGGAMSLRSDQQLVNVLR